MSPEYRVEIVATCPYVVDATDVDDAEKKAWQMFENDLDDYGHPAVVGSIDEIKEQSKAEPGQTAGQSDLGEIQGLIAKGRDIQEHPLTAMLYRLTAEGRMPKIVVQVDDETSQVEAPRYGLPALNTSSTRPLTTKANQSRSSGTKVRRRRATRFQPTSCRLMAGLAHIIPALSKRTVGASG